MTIVALLIAAIVGAAWLSIARWQKTYSDPALWHEIWSFFPKRTVDGGWTKRHGRIWRRQFDGKWQYRQDPETREEYLERQYW